MVLFDSKNPVETKNDILNQNIFGNSHIAKDGRSLFYPHWSRSNFVKIKDVWNTENVTWKEGNVIYNNIRCKNNWISEFTKIKAYIPYEWKQLLKGEPVGDETKQILQNTKPLKLSFESIQLNKNEIFYKNVKQKDIFFTCLYPTAPPTCVNTWSIVFGTELKINDVFVQMNCNIHNRKCLNFHWKLAHRALFSEKRLQRMNKSDGKCKICKYEDETLCHLVRDCSKIFPVWTLIEHLLNDICNEDINLSTRDILFGIRQDRFISPVYSDVANFIILAAKWEIWKQRNNVKMEGAQVIKSFDMFKKIVDACNSQIDLLQHSKKWDKINLALKIILNNVKCTELV